MKPKGMFFGDFALAKMHPTKIILILFLIAYPAVASDFFIFQIGAYSLILGLIALSLMMLAGYGGMVSLAQLTIAGFAGYLVAIFGSNSVEVMGFGWPWWLVICLALLGASLLGAFIGAISSSTAGIYTIMITLAISVAFFFFVRQNYNIFNGFTGFAGIKPPIIFGIDWRAPTPFYYLTLAVTASCYWWVVNSASSTFGLALQAIRDNPRRLAALGYHVTLHRIVAHLFAGLIAGIAGILLVWFNGRISPGSIGVDVVIDILIIAVVGGLKHPIGPFLGAVAFVLLENFAIDLIDRERFNTVIGLAFLLVVLFSPDGLLGLFKRMIAKIRFKKAGLRAVRSAEKSSS